MENSKCCFVFNGYCSVAACSETLIKHNIDNRIMKLPVNIRNSCSFAVIIDIKDAEFSKNILSKEGICVEKMLYYD